MTFGSAFMAGSRAHATIDPTIAGVRGASQPPAAPVAAVRRHVVDMRRTGANRCRIARCSRMPRRPRSADVRPHAPPRGRGSRSERCRDRHTRDGSRMGQWAGINEPRCVCNSFAASWLPRRYAGLECRTLVLNMTRCVRVQRRGEGSCASRRSRTCTAMPAGATSRS